jgi:hypothetical protein
VKLHWNFGGSSSGISVADPSLGEIVVFLSAAQTALLSWDKGYRYDVQIKSGNDVWTSLIGDVIVPADVTHGTVAPLS